MATTVSMARPNLRDLPEELVSNISLRLCSDDVQAFRLTCKSLEQKTLHEWATEYFSEKGILISSDSLKALLNIANSAKLRGFLRRIHVLTLWFSDTPLTSPQSCPHGRCCGWQPTVRQREAWKFLCQDQRELKESAQDKKMLTEAFSKLPSLCDISIVDSLSAVSVAADIRSIRKVARLCGRNAMVPADASSDIEYQRVLSHTWSILTSAIAFSGMKKLKRFGSSLGKENDILCVPFDFRFSDTKLERLKAVFSKTESLRLQLSPRMPKRPSRSHMQTFAKMGPKRLQGFANTFSTLQTLTVDFDGYDTDQLIFTNLMNNLDLSKLKKLQINTLSVDRASLVEVFKRIRHIQELFLNCINLSKGAWVPVLKQMQTFSQLEHLHMMFLLENGKKAYFLAQPDEDEEMAAEDMMFDDLMMNGPLDDFVVEGDESDGSDDELPPLETMDGEIVHANEGASPHTTPLPATVEDEVEQSASEANGGANTTEAPPSATHSAIPQATTNNHSSATSTQAPAPKVLESHGSPEHKAPGSEHYPERGYYICLRGRDNNQNELKTFIREYNLGEGVNGAVPPGGLGAMGGMGAGIMGAMGGGGMGGVGAMTIPLPVPAGHPAGQPPNMNNILDGLAGYLGLPPMPGQPGGGAAGGGGGQGAGNAGGGAAANGTAHLTGGQASSTNTAAGAAAGAPPPPGQASAGASAGAGTGVGASIWGPPAEDEWDTEGESSEFMSEDEDGDEMPGLV